MKQEALFVSLCAGCNGSSWVDDPDEERASGWVVGCPDCNPTGRRHYDPDRAAIPF